MGNGVRGEPGRRPNKTGAGGAARAARRVGGRAPRLTAARRLPEMPKPRRMTVAWRKRRNHQGRDPWLETTLALLSHLRKGAPVTATCSLVLLARRSRALVLPLVMFPDTEIARAVCPRGVMACVGGCGWSRNGWLLRARTGPNVAASR